MFLQSASLPGRLPRRRPGLARFTSTAAARDASRAGATLQLATRTRLADYLGLPRPSPSISERGAEQALVSAVSAVTGRPAADVGALLLGPPPTRDEHLLGLDTELAALEKEVRRS